MHGSGDIDSIPEAQQLDLRATIAAATRALALLDADRLEELARSCHKLNSDLPKQSRSMRANFARRSAAASGELAALAHVLEATRANLNVMRRLRDLREGNLEYGCPQPSL